MEKAIEIPFGAKDSELLEWVYFIPEGMEAEIKDRKVIIKKAESEDERIRRELLEYAKGEVRSYDNMVSGDYDSRDKEDKMMHKWWQKIVAYLEKQKEQKPIPANSVGLKEQKPAEWNDSVAKEMFIKALERAVEQTKSGYELTDCDKHSWWEDFKAYSEIKPAEWSENDSLHQEQESIAERFAKIVRANLSEIGKNAQSQFEQLYFEITGDKMYGRYND